MLTENAIDGISLEQTAAGVRLSVRVAATAAVEANLLRAVELAAPGDTRLWMEDDMLVASRFLAEPTDAALHEAAAALMKTTTHVTRIIATRAQEVPPAATQRFPDLSWTQRLFDGFFTVDTPQPGRRQPDPSEPASTELQPGAWYRVLERTGDWAMVRGEDGVTAYTDFRRLQPVSARTPASTWAPTHTVPDGGVLAWPAPDPDAQPISRVDPGVPLRVVERKGAWANVIASNGWAGWVDGRALKEWRRGESNP